MAIDHRILQSIGATDNANVLNMFNNALLARQNRKVSDEQLRGDQIRNTALEQQQTEANTPQALLLKQQEVSENIEKAFAT